jgi:hypothetical protein
MMFLLEPANNEPNKQPFLFLPRSLPRPVSLIPSGYEPRGRRIRMSIFGNIMNKIFRHDPAGGQPAPAQAQPAGGDAATITAPSPAPTTAPSNVDVGAVLGEMASMKDGGGNYQTSIVDLLKLLDMDSSLDARKDLANELNVHAGADGSAEQNIALHKAVMDKLAENGGVIPDSLRN